MSKTIKQIADELGVSKQKVYRYIKANCISEAHHENGVMHFDETAENLIKQGLSGGDVHRDAHHEVHQNHINDALNETVVNLLREELTAKNKQISDLEDELARERKHSRELADKITKIADQAQKLHLAQMRREPEQLVENSEVTVTVAEPEQISVPESVQRRKLFSWPKWRKKQ